MSGEWFNWSAVGPTLVSFFCIILTGLVIKLMDDVMDMEYDTLLGKKTLAHTLGRAALPYGLLGFGIAVYLRPSVTIALFLASYVIGMGHELRERMPTKLTGWMESGIAIVVMIGLTGVELTSWAICIMVVIQLLDDISDMRDDAKTGQRNYAVRFGIVEMAFVLLIAFAISVLEFTTLSVLVLLSLPTIHWIVSFLERRLKRAHTQ
jgi:1,4-dihydroxy-2-naphthoate octaprenyltransferase